MSEETPKSAYELALERLRKRDAEEGTVEVSLTDAQKEAIAEARRVCEAKLAELEILHKSKVARLADPQARASLEENYRRDIQRARDERDHKIAKIRSSN